MTTVTNTARFARKTAEKRRRYIVKKVNRMLAYLGDCRGPGIGAAVDVLEISDAPRTWEGVAFLWTDGPCAMLASVSWTKPWCGDSVVVLGHNGTSLNVVPLINSGRFVSVNGWYRIDRESSVCWRLCEGVAIFRCDTWMLVTAIRNTDKGRSTLQSTQYL